MLKIFRNIRRQLIDSGKAKNYLLYAIGEITLIVIGILIALQINNWNEARKSASLELKILKGLNMDLEANVQRIHAAIQNDSFLVENNESLLKILKNEKSVYHDSLSSKFAYIEWYDAFTPKSLAYETLKSKGLETITNDALRAEIVVLYDDLYANNEIINETKRDLLSNSFPIITKYLETGYGFNQRKPNNFNALKQNTEFRNYVTYVTEMKRFFLQDHYRGIILPRTLEVKEAIEAEIKKREK